MTETTKYRLIPGCFAFRHRWHIVNTTGRVMIVDQPKQGFVSREIALAWLDGRFYEANKVRDVTTPRTDLDAVLGEEIEGAR